MPPPAPAAAAAGSAGTGSSTGARTAHRHTRGAGARRSCIQGYLQRVQRQTGIGGLLGGGLGGLGGADASPFTDFQLELIRGLQRSFRAHLSSQQTTAHELHSATAAASALSDAEHARLCAILRRASAAGGGGGAAAAARRSERGCSRGCLRSSRSSKRRAAGIIERVARPREGE